MVRLSDDVKRDNSQLGVHFFFHDGEALTRQQYPTDTMTAKSFLKSENELRAQALTPFVVVENNIDVLNHLKSEIEKVAVTLKISSRMVVPVWTEVP